MVTPRCHHLTHELAGSSIVDMTMTLAARGDGVPIGRPHESNQCATAPDDRHLVRLPVGATCALWAVATASGGVGAWQLMVLHGRAACSGALCTIATLGGHPQLLVTLAAFCVATLLGFAPCTRGLTRADPLLLGPITVAAVAGAASLLGVVALVALTLIVAAGALVALVAVLDRS